MTYVFEHFDPETEADRPPHGPETEMSRALEVASRKAAAAGERPRQTASELVEISEYWGCLWETVRQLSMLDDAGLRASGLQRSQIMGAARRAALAKQAAPQGCAD